MSRQFEDPEETKLEEEMISEASAEKKIQHIAEKAAEKSSNTTKRYDEDHPIFSK